MIPGIHYLCDDDLLLLAQSHTERADLDMDESRAAYSREYAEALRGELAGRRIERSIHDDPCAYYWFGRLSE